MDTLARIKKQLELVLRDTAHRAEHVSEFQKLVWNSSELGLGVDLEEVVRDLAYDLDFYQPSSECGVGNPPQYGDSRLEREVRGVLTRFTES